MEYLRGFDALKLDPEWVNKVALASLFCATTMVFPLLGQLVVGGFVIESMKRDLRGERGMAPLAFDVDQLGKYLEPGFKHFLAQLLYSLPFVGLVIPLAIGLSVGIGYLAAASGGGDPSAGGSVAALFSAFAVLGVIAVLGVGGFLMLGLATFAALRVDLTGDLAQAFELREIFASFRRNMKEVLVGNLVQGFVGMFLFIAGYLCCFVGVFISLTVMLIVGAYFHADLARLDRERGGTLELPRTPSVAETFG